MKDYTKEIEFWKRLQSFVSDVQTECCTGEEEKEMIMHNCKLKILEEDGEERKEGIGSQESTKEGCLFYGWKSTSS